MYKSKSFETIIVVASLILFILLIVANFCFESKIDDPIKGNFYNNFFSVATEVIVGVFSAIFILILQRKYSEYYFKKDFDITGTYSRIELEGKLKGKYSIDGEGNKLTIKIEYSEGNKFSIISEYFWGTPHINIKIASGYLEFDSNLSGTGKGKYEYKDEQDFGTYNFQVLGNTNKIFVRFKNESHGKNGLEGNYILEKRLP